MKASAETVGFSLKIDATVDGGRARRLTMDLTWDAGTVPKPRVESAPAEESEPSFESALERQLGLKLIKSTAPFRTVVVD